MAETLIRALGPADRAWALEMVRAWGSDFVVSRGRKIYAAELQGVCAVSSIGERTGLATYEVVGDQCQLVTLHAFVLSSPALAPGSWRRSETRLLKRVAVAFGLSPQTTISTRYASISAGGSCWWRCTVAYAM